MTAINLHVCCPAQRKPPPLCYPCRGHEAVRLTDFATGVRYMDFTEAVTRSAQSGRAVSLPLLV